MKKLLLTLALAGCVSSAFSQGQIVYYNRVSGTSGPVALVYGANPNNLSESKVGNTSAGVPGGTQTYAGLPLAGSGYSAGLWAGTTAENLVFIGGSLRDFRSGGFAGAINNSGGVLTFPTAPGFGEASQPFLQLRAWDNLGGTITSWDQVLADPNILRGSSPVFQAPALGGQAPPPNMLGLQSFNIYAVPEPSTFVLAGLGAAALMFIRRRK